MSEATYRRYTVMGLRLDFPREEYEWRGCDGDSFTKMDPDSMDADERYVVKTPPTELGYEVFYGMDTQDIEEDEGPDFHIVKKTR